MTVGTVPFLDVGATYRELRHEIDDAVRRVLERGHFILGEEVERFESTWSAACGARHCVGVGSGLDALVLILRALDVGPGHEVIVPSHTFIATWLAVTAVGATPVPVEPDPATRLIDPASVEEVITSRTAAVIPVHLYGRPVDVDGFDALGRKHGIPVVHDAAQAHGASVAGRPVGRFGVASAWSFYPGKNLGAFGDAGAITTDDDELADRVRRLRNYGSSRKYVHDVIGTNSRLDEVQAAILTVKASRLDEWNARRSAVADIYRAGLAGTGLGLPDDPADVAQAWHLFVVTSDDRDRLRSEIGSSGVETGIHYPVPPHQQAAYRTGPAANLPVAEELSRTVLSLPIGPHLSVADATRVVEIVRSVSV